jgi:SSS family solute:Na+ symporter
VAVSLATRPRAEHELKGLVYSLTPRLSAVGERWYARPAVLGACVLAGAIVLNLIFR